LSALGCAANPFSGGEDGFSAEDWERVLELEPLVDPLGPSAFNEYADDVDAARLGQRLFFDKEFASAVRVAGPSGEVGQERQVACATCHAPEAYFSDSRPTGGVSHGVEYTARNSPSLVNVAYYTWFDWAGRADTLASQGAVALETQFNASSNRLFVAHEIYAKYKDEYEAIFGPLDPALAPDAPDAARFPAAGRPKLSADAADGPWEQMTADDRRAIERVMANIGKAFEAYERNLISGNSPFARYVRDPNGGDYPAAARRGLALFIGKAACNECHIGPILSDNRFHNGGVTQAVGENTPLTDDGRFEDIAVLLRNPYNAAGVYSDDPVAGAARLASLSTTDESTKGQFRTKSLLNVAVTGPYFHNGSKETLEEVVQHYNVGGGEPGSYSGQLDAKMRPLRLTEAEVRDVVAFLETLTGDPVPEEWRTDPFASE
jgi:cytochrome c peroxidase